MVEFNKAIFPSWPNLSEKTAVFTSQPWDWEISESEVTRVRSMAKPDRQRYMERVDISWNAYSAVKGENWFHPVSNENPPYQIMAFVADYDVPIDFQFVDAACRERLRLGGWVPTFVETSLSKHIRCIWTFEIPVLTNGNKLAIELLKRIGKLVDAESFLPGLDLATYKPQMRWTNGGYWHQIDFAQPIPGSILTGIALEAIRATETRQVNLPLDKASELLREKFPRFKLFNGGMLKTGAAGIRFWDDKADNPNGALCVERGFTCVTGEKGFMPWEDLLGKIVVDKLRLANYGDVAKDIFFDGRTYWRRTRTDFVNWDRPDILMHIASHGYDRSRQKNDPLSAAESVLNYIHAENRVDGAAPLLYRPVGRVRYQNTDLLNICRARPMVMADKLDASPADFPWLWGFFDKVFASPELKPREHFFSWWKRFYEGAVNQKPTNGQAIFFCGPQGCGKNLISELILPTAMGGSAPNPYKYLMGETDFSDELFSSPLLAINDEDAPPEHKRTIFEQKIKAMVANNNQSYHPKFMKKVQITWDGRLVVTLNDGPKDIGLLPMINPNTFHKVDFFRAQKHDHPFYDKAKNVDIVTAELPFLLRWLVDTFDVPPECVSTDRFGVAPFHDPQLIKVNRQEQVSYNLLELLGAWMSHEKGSGGAARWTGSPTDLIQAMTGDDSLEMLLKDWKPTTIGRALGDLARSETPGVVFDPLHKGRRFVLERAQILATVRGQPFAPATAQSQMENL